MNVFRLLFLFTCLAAGILWSIVTLAPGVFEQTTRDHLTIRLEAEARSVLHAEQAATNERALAAARIAQSPALVDALRPSQPTLGPDGNPQLPTRPTPTAAFAAAIEALGSGATPQTLALFDVDGALLAPTDGRALVSPAELAEAAGLASVLRDRTPRTIYFGRTGALHAAALHPVLGPTGELLGAVLVAEAYDGRTAVARRGNSSAHVAYFVEREVIATSDSDSARAELARSLVRRQTALDIGSDFGLRRVEYDRYTPATDADILPAMMLASAPLALDSSDASRNLGMVVTVDVQAPPPTLLAILIESQAFADSTVVLWAYVALGLGIFLIGLFIHDLSVDRSVQAFAGRISDSVTNNDPPPLRVDSFPAMLRPAARAFNTFLDAYRAQLATARRSREDAEAARDAAEQAKDEAIRAHNDAMQARVEVDERVRNAEDRVRAESSGFGSGPLAVAAMNAKIAAATSEARPDVPTFEVSGAQPAVADPDAESLEDLAEAMEIAAHAEEQERKSEQNVAAEMEEIVAQFAFDGPSLRTGVQPVASADAAVLPGSAQTSAAHSESVPEAPHTSAPPLAPPPEPGSYDPQAQTSPPVQREVPRRSTQLLAAVGGMGAPVDTGNVPRLAPPRPPAPPPVRATARLTAISGPAAAVTGDVDPVGATLGLEARPVLSAGSLAPAPETAPLAAAVPEAAAATAPVGLQGSPRQAPLPPAPPTRETDAGARRGVANPNAAVFEEPPLDEMLNALDSIQDTSMAGTVPRATREEMARKAAEAKAAARPDHILAAAEERLRRLRSPTGSMQALAASQLPGANVLPLPVAAPTEPVAGDSPETRALYAQFIEARRSCGELEELPYDRFVRRLEKNRTALKAQLNCSDVRFRVDIEGGKATLKASPVR